MKGGLLLDVVVGQSSAILKLLSSEDKSLLIWRDSFFVLDLGFDVLDSVCWLNIKSDGFTSEGLNEDLHTSSESEHKMESRFFLDVVVGESSAVFKLFSSENESLLVWWDSFLVLNFSLDIFNGICWLDIESDGLSSKGLDEDLHTSSKSEDEMEG